MTTDNKSQPPLAASTLDVSAQAERAAVLDLMYCYAEAVDRRSYELLPAIFTSDAVLTGPGFEMQGLEAIDQGLRINEQFDLTQHFVMNHRATLEGDRGTAETYCLAYHLTFGEGTQSRMDMGIRYQDLLQRGDDRWLIQRRELCVDWTRQSTVES